MIVVCIENNLTNFLTLNKLYEVLNITYSSMSISSSYAIIDDRNKKCLHFKSRFITLDEYRINKIDTILC